MSDKVDAWLENDFACRPEVLSATIENWGVFTINCFSIVTAVNVDDIVNSETRLEA